jgi:hypothetical protein
MRHSMFHILGLNLCQIWLCCLHQRDHSREVSYRERIANGRKGRGCVSLAPTDMQQTERRPCDLSRISYFSQPSVRGCSYYMKASSSLFDVKVSPSLNSQRRLDHHSSQISRARAAPFRLQTESHSVRGAALTFSPGLSKHTHTLIRLPVRPPL